jgi:hypothetical protein
MRVGEDDGEVVAAVLDKRPADAVVAVVPGRETSPTGKSRVGRLTDMRASSCGVGRRGSAGGRPGIAGSRPGSRPTYSRRPGRGVGRERGACRSDESRWWSWSGDRRSSRAPTVPDEHGRCPPAVAVPRDCRAVQGGGDRVHGLGVMAAWMRRLMPVSSGTTRGSTSRLQDCEGVTG